jgi:hypothetical protein
MWRGIAQLFFQIKQQFVGLQFPDKNSKTKVGNKMTVAIKLIINQSPTARGRQNKELANKL